MYGFSDKYSLNTVFNCYLQKFTNKSTFIHFKTITLSSKTGRGRFYTRINYWYTHMMESLKNTPAPKQESFNQDRLDLIAEAYGLDTLSFVASPESGIITENAILEDENGKKYFAKRYQAEDSKRHAATYRASEIVATDPRVPVVLPLLPQDGAYTVEIAGTSFSLFDYVEHDSSSVEDFEEMEQLVFNTAQTLGRIHSAPIDSSETLLRPIKRWTPEAGQERIIRLQEIVTRIESKEDRDEFDELSLIEARFKLGFIETAGEPPVTNVPLTICHADFHNNNVLHDENMNIVAVIDWDNAGLANPYTDFLNAFYTYVERGKIKSQEEKLSLATAFIRGYEDGVGSYLNLEALQETYPSFIEERVASMWPMYQHYFNGDFKNDDKLAGRSAQIRVLAENPDEMLDLIRTAVTSD
jgi:aminoglycoside phosphotransferase (APT) family kinase protein